MSADIRYAGSAAQHIQILLVPRMAAKSVAGLLNRTTQGDAQILHTLRRERAAWRYTGLDNSS